MLQVYILCKNVTEHSNIFNVRKICFLYLWFHAEWLKSNDDTDNSEIDWASEFLVKSHPTSSRDGLPSDVNSDVLKDYNVQENPVSIPNELSQEEFSKFIFYLGLKLKFKKVK